MEQKCIFERFRTGDDGKSFLKKVEKLLQEGFVIIPTNPMLVSDTFGWTTVMIFLQKELK